MHDAQRLLRGASHGCEKWRESNTDGDGLNRVLALYSPLGGYVVYRLTISQWVGRLFGIPVGYPSSRVSKVEDFLHPEISNKVIMSAGGQLCGCVERDAAAERRAAADYAQGRATRSSRRRAHV